ncbi:hypothetical protein PDTA9832_31320 [Phytobacter diazotrophicus]|nr:hypothetical protein PDTA9832_31320 [Phytobacter diazotrophicus]
MRRTCVCRGNTDRETGLHYNLFRYYDPDSAGSPGRIR